MNNIVKVTRQQVAFIITVLLYIDCRYAKQDVPLEAVISLKLWVPEMSFKEFRPCYKRSDKFSYIRNISAHFLSSVSRASMSTIVGWSVQKMQKVQKNGELSICLQT